MYPHPGDPMSRFPDAPFYAEFTEDGWMVIGDECWTPDEWARLTVLQRRKVTGDVPLLDETEEQAKKRQKRVRERLTKAMRAA